MKRHLLTLLVLGLAAFGYSQNDADLKRRAKEFFAYNRYEDALATLQSSRSLVRNDKEGKFLIALCHYHLNNLDEAAGILNRLVEQESEPYPECWFYLGRILHAQHQFVEAGKNYKIYLKNTPANNPNRSMVVDMVRRCANGQQYQFKTGEAIVENLGRQVNTRYDEFAPVLSPTYSDRLYFSSARPGSMGGKRNAQGTPDERTGQFFYDMFVSSVVNGAWGNVQPMPYQLNSPRHEQLLDFNGDGQALLYFKGMTMDRGEIMVDTFRQREERLLRSDPFLSPMRAQDGDRNLFLYNDTLLFFASRRPGGYGGLDLYKTTFKNGRWSTPQNLGADINTPYDETTPFLASDGRALYFSSNFAERSIGGLDVFKSVYIPDLNRWTEPQNLGLPINSAADDAHFRIARDGFTGFFSSARKDGLGQRDLYIAYFNTYREEMEPPTPVVTYNEPPVQNKPQPTPPTRTSTPPANSSTMDDDPFDDPPRSVEPEPEVPANSLTFNAVYDIDNNRSTKILNNISQQLLADRSRSLVITAYALEAGAGAAEMSQAIRAAERAAGYLTRKGVADAAIFMRGAIGKSQSANERFAMVFDVNDGGDFSPKGQATVYDAELQQDLVYKVQIASSKSGNYNSDLLRRFDHPMVEKTLDFAYYRYTVGAVSTYAEALRLQARARADVPSAYIAAYVRGRRVERGDAGRFVREFPDLEKYAR